jgi:alginate O-acetyltransferase complex protein AlgI
LIFNSFTFAIFFAHVLAVHSQLSQWTSKKAALLIASYLFYAAWNPPFALILAFSTAVDWVAARQMGTPRYRRAALTVSLISNLGLLAFFKYSNFFLENYRALASHLGVSHQPPELDIVLPVGISFYTFQTLSFTIDVYRGQLDPKKFSLLDFALFVSFFPQLVAGPIVRAADFLPQLLTPDSLARRNLSWGFCLLTLGLFEKTVLADTFLAPASDLVFGAEGFSTTDAWIGALAFSGQIFFDFAGYSTCAIGVAICLGFSLPDNFRNPYGAAGFSDFWRRWHISLSTWLRDYLYIALGGNRRGLHRTYLNLFLTMLLGGLWHGASWNFVLWGALHGTFLVVERALRGPSAKPNTGWWLITQVGVLIAWIPFRAPTLEQTGHFLATLAGLSGPQADVTTLANRVLVAATVVGLYGVHIRFRSTSLERLAGRMHPITIGAGLGVCWLSIWLAQPEDRSFIYFQF